MVLGSTVRKRSSSLVKILLYTHLTASWGAGSRAAPGFFLGLGPGFVSPPLKFMDICKFNGFP